MGLGIWMENGCIAYIPSSPYFLGGCKILKFLKKWGAGFLSKLGGVSCLMEDWLKFNVYKVNFKFNLKDLPMQHQQSDLYYSKSLFCSKWQIVQCVIFTENFR